MVRKKLADAQVIIHPDKMVEWVQVAALPRPQLSLTAAAKCKWLPFLLATVNLRHFINANRLLNYPLPLPPRSSCRLAMPNRLPCTPAPASRLAPRPPRTQDHKTETRRLGLLPPWSIYRP